MLLVVGTLLATVLVWIFTGVSPAGQIDYLLAWAVIAFAEVKEFFIHRVPEIWNSIVAYVEKKFWDFVDFISHYKPSNRLVIMHLISVRNKRSGT